MCSKDDTLARTISAVSGASTAVSSTTSPTIIQRPPGPHIKHSYIRSEPDSAPKTGRKLCLFFVRSRRLLPHLQPPRAHPADLLSLFVLYDGTGNAFGQSFTNIPTMLSLVSEDPTKVMTYYQTGIGTSLTYDPAWGLKQIVRKIGQIVDAGVGWSLQQHICAGYRWLMDVFKPGDSILIFGFSRGAYTARALAGMLQSVGLLPYGNEETIPLVYSIYTNATEEELIPGETVAEGFRRTFSREVCIDLVGVFDTVSSVGALYPRTLPFANRSEYIHRFRQAYSLDERRARFSLQPWVRSKGKKEGTDVLEVAFAGCHSQCGGGQFEYDGDIGPNLAHLPLIWMLKEAVEAGLDLDRLRVATSPLFQPFYQQAIDATSTSTKQNPELTLYLDKVKKNNPFVNETVAATVWLASRPNPHATADALAPRADVISLRIDKKPLEVRRQMGWKARLGDWWSRRTQQVAVLGWWLLEVSPTLKLVWDDEGQVKKWSLKPNFGSGRKLPKRLHFHFSVRERLAAKPGSFAPGNNESTPEGENGYHFAARFRKNQSMANVKWEGEVERPAKVQEQGSA